MYVQLILLKQTFKTFFQGFRYDSISVTWQTYWDVATLVNSGSVK